MEKIQAALAKARAERPQKMRAHQSIDPSTDAGTIDTRWSALPHCDLDPVHLQEARVRTVAGGREAAPFDVMRTKALQMMRANNWRRLAITSPSPGCGKSTLALNLAFSLGRQPELSSIVMELDLRKPSLARTLDVRAPACVSGVLEGRTSFADQALRHGENLAFSLCAGPVSNPADLLHNPATAAALATIEADYAPDIMIFDMPPMLVSDDMMAFAGLVDCVLLVAAAEETTIKDIDICERELASQTNVMGVLLNKCRFMGKDYGYSYY